MKNIKKFLSFCLVMLMTIASLANTGFEIKAASKQAVVYYYNTNWTKANIHYKVGNGNWTSVPGVAMEKSSEQAGYTWKYVIDLGSADNATVCFNNGNGDWDSRNSQNYTVKAGSYGVKNQTVKALTTVTPTPTVTPEFKTTISANTTSGTVGTEFTFVGNSHNEYGHRYNSHYFNIKDVKTGEFVQERMYAYTNSEGYTTSWKAEKAGKYEVSFCAQEYCGRYAESSVIVTVAEPEFKTTIKANTTSGTLDTTFRFVGNSYNEKGHRYNAHYFSVKDVKTGAVVEESLYALVDSEGYTTSWKADKEGTYEVTFVAREYCGRTAKSSTTITVKDNAVKATIAADKTSVKVGTEVNLTATVENEVGHRYNTHQFYFKNLSTGEVEYSYPLSAYGTNFNYTWTPSKAGTYEASFMAQEYGSSRGDVATMKITVKDVTKNTVKVYYNNSNWSQANIHYQIGNGNWTKVPGVTMQPSDDSKYTWMYTIDLGDASSANVCFNNGNGSWDSRNSANYQVGTGTYEVIYGSAHKIAD